MHLKNFYMHIYFNVKRILSCNNLYIRNALIIKGLNDGLIRPKLVEQK
jgi:hypothetical protein